MLKNSLVVGLGLFSKFCSLTYLKMKDCFFFACLQIQVRACLKQTRYWNGPGHFVALHLKHVPRRNFQKCRRSNTSLCHFQSPLVRDMSKVKIWCPYYVEFKLCTLGPAWLLSAYRALQICISLPKMPCCQKIIVLANPSKEKRLQRLP